VLRRESRPAVGRALDAELTHPMAQGVGMKIQDFRRALRAINHAIRMPQGCLDMSKRRVGI
jgi:hypothetical protein